MEEKRRQRENLNRRKGVKERRVNVKKYGRVKGIIICKLSILVFLRFCIRPRGNDNEFKLQATNNRNYI